jgi:serine/threonine-protein kinase
MATPEQKYRIIDKLDSGGMAEIYRAEAELIQGLKKQVAIKRILPHLTKNKKFVAMFLDEARVSLFLNHANIVHVYDIGRAGDTYFIVMEYVNGVNLRDLSDSVQKRGAFDLAQALFISMELCKGLGYAHDMVSPDDGRPLYIVHRDVSPPNVLLSGNGEVKLVDFGLAKAATQLETTDPGVVKGKFSYLSPEAANGEEVDWRSDIFAVGIILFELLAGRRLFLGETDYQTVELVRQARVPPLSSLNSRVPKELEDIVAKALARRREDRFQHAYELQDAVAQFLFARGLKITSRDIARQVRATMTERQQERPAQTRSQGVIDQLIQEELVKFTSLDPATKLTAVGSQPPSPNQLMGSGPLNPDDFLSGGNRWTNRLSAQDGEDLSPLENVLEGEDTEEPPVAPAVVAQAEKPASKTRGLIVALILFVLLGAATILALHRLGLLTDGSSNRDIAPAIENRVPRN